MFRLNTHAIVDRLRALALRLLDERPEVLAVRLFGSLARGAARPGSDADVLVLLDHSPTPFVDRIGEYARYLSGTGVACDVLCYTEREFAQLREQNNPFIRAAWNEGIVLAERTPARFGRRALTI